MVLLMFQCHFYHLHSCNDIQCVLSNTVNEFIMLSWHNAVVFTHFKQAALSYSQSYIDVNFAGHDPEI